MILFWFLGLIPLALDGINSQVQESGTNFHFSQNANWQAVISYMLQSNHFFPMDTYFAIALIYFGMYGFMLLIKVVEVVLNVVRGAGIRF